MQAQQMNSLYSNAFNFNSFLQGGVDPRTGIYTFSLSLGEITSVSAMGLSLDVVLQFNPLNVVNVGFGTGWSIALSRYDTLNKIMTLSTGERYKATELESSLIFAEQKLNTVKVTRPDVDHFHLFNINGTRETLKIHEESGSAIPVQIMAANGASIFLRYVTYNEQPVLSEVRDEQRLLLKVAASDNQVALTQYPGTVAETRITLFLTDERISTIRLPTGEEWTLQYEIIGGLGCLTQVDSPRGAREVIGYTEDGHLLPPLAPMHSMPCVSSHKVYPQYGQPAILTEYAFSDANFLGFGGEFSWSEEGDNLDAAASDYVYTSTENLMLDGQIHHSTLRTYNRFHLLQSQITTCADAVTSDLMEYPLEPGKSIAGQPPQFRLPRAMTRRYKNSKTGHSRDEVTLTEFDSFGNLIKQVEPSGVTTVSEFYPVTGADGCPADTSGFIRYVKQRTVIPASSDVAASTTVTRFRYALHKGLNGSQCSMILPVEEKLYELADKSETLRSSCILTYFDTPQDSTRHGLLSHRTLEMNGLKTCSEHQYSIAQDILTLGITTVGFDGASTTSLQTFSALNGMKRSERSEDDGVTRFKYDSIGRILSTTVSAGTPNAATSHTVYQAASHEAPATMHSTDLAGVLQTTAYDGLGRIIGMQEQDCDSPDKAAIAHARVIFAARHDGLGRLIEQTHTDWWEEVARPMTTTFEYDDWGQVKTTLHPDGRKEHRTYDPVTRTETYWFEGMGKSITRFNDFGKPDTVEAFDRKEQSLGKIVHGYDGWGRAVSQTDAVGNRTTFGYDVFNRLCRSELPDGHVVETEFAIHSPETLPTRMKMSGQSLGQQTFDGLGRLTASTIGGRTCSAGYEGGSGQPTWQKSASGERVEFDYARDFGGRLLQRKATGSVANYTYSPSHGQPTSCIEQGRETRFEYYPSGRLKNEITVGAQLQTASYTYSFGGRPLTYTDVLGNQHKTGYDEWGRAVSFEQGALKADLVYGALGLLERIDSQDRQTGRSLETRLTYDDLGRETSRTFVIDGIAAQTQALSYSLDGKLAQKVLSSGETVLRDEHFTYDQRGRLSGYTCDGSQRPRDPYGKEIVSQHYVFDALDNIVSVRTEFPGGDNLATFTYSAVDPSQLIEVRHSHTDYPALVTLEYDADGQMIKDDLARSLSYDPLGRLTRIATATGAVIRDYHYDARDRLVELSGPAGTLAQRFYHEGRVINEINGSDLRTCWRQSGLLLGERRSDVGVQQVVTDLQQSVLTIVSDTQRSEIAYSPYGFRPAEGGVFSLAGFNGEQLDPLTGLYLLGNGYRAYSPTLMRFLSPDNLSPFGAGGLNPYAYCLGDPINRVDPTGHVSWQSGLGIGLSIVSIAASILTFGATTPLAIASLTLALASGITGIASAVAHEVAPQSELGDILGYVSLGLGVASAVAGAGATLQGASKVAGKLRAPLSGDPARAARAMKNGMSGRAKAGSSAGIERAGSTTQATEAAAARWTYTTPRNLPGFEKLEGSSLARFFQFKNLIRDKGLSPEDAAMEVGKHTKFNEMIKFDVRKADPKTKINNSGYTEIRLNAGLRLLFTANRDTRVVTLHKISHTIKGA